MENLKKVRRTFSTEFKKEKVSLIEQGKLKISEVCKVYEVSKVSVGKWMILYGKKFKKTERIVIEKISEEEKNVELMKRIAELERIIGQQQLQLIYKNAIIKCASDLCGEDIEKKYSSQR